MNTSMGAGLALLAAYLLGSVPNGLVVARLRGVDIRSVGSGNIGATNVFRAVGKGWGILTFAMDFLKGLVPAMAFPTLAGCPGTGMALACGFTAVAGHNWSAFLGFKGGKGVATSAGVLLAVAPLAALIGLAVWAMLLVATGYVAVASMGAALSIPAAAWLLLSNEGQMLPSVLTVMGLLVIYTHRSNIARLANGTEHRFNILRKSKS